MGARFNKEMQDYGQLPVTGIAAPMDPEMGMMLKPDAQAGPPVEQMELEGGAQKPGFSNTLDESVSDTLMRDIMMVLNKLKFVMWPRGGGIQQLGKDWDLWGPLLLCLALSMILSWNAPEEQKALVFAAVFVIVWLGSAVVTLNALLLGGNLSFFHSVCVLGYCIFPLDVAALLCTLWSNPVWKTIVVPVCFVWSTGASVGFLQDLVPEKRAMLALYPVVLFYMVIAWIVWVE